MERNTASSAEEERETQGKSIAQSHRYDHCCLGPLEASVSVTNANAFLSNRECVLTSYVSVFRRRQ